MATQIILHLAAIRKLLRRPLPQSLVARLGSDLDGEQVAPTVSQVCLLAARCLAAATTSSVADVSRFVGGLGVCQALV